MIVSHLPWAAGLFEGEGCFSSSLTNDKYGTRGFRARLAMTDRDVVLRFRQAIGFGSFRISLQKNPAHKTQWVWYSTRFEQFQATVAILWPWLGSRRRAKAKELLLMARDYHATRLPRFGRGAK